MATPNGSSRKKKKKNGVILKIKIMGQHWGWQDMAVNCLLEVLEGSERHSILWNVDLQMGEAKNKRVEVCIQPPEWDSGLLNQRRQ